MFTARQRNHDDSWLSPPLPSHLTAIGASFVLLFTWFSSVPAAWEATRLAEVISGIVARPTERLSGGDPTFALLSAVLHTALVGVGLYLGHDASLMTRTKQRFGALALAIAITFFTMAAVLSVCFTHIGYAAVFFDARLPFAAMGAASLTLPAAVACTVPLWQPGTALLHSPRLHALLVVIALIVHSRQGDFIVLGSGSATASIAALCVTRAYPAGMGKQRKQRLASL